MRKVFSFLALVLSCAMLCLGAESARAESDKPQGELRKLPKAARDYPQNYIEFGVGKSALGRVNINEASQQELAKLLSGVGKTKAARIVEYRRMNGPFETVDDLQRVRGIGAAILDKNRDRLTL